MKNKIAGLSMNFSELTFKNIDNINFSSSESVLSYDILIIDLNHVIYEYSFKKDSVRGHLVYHRGAPLLDEVDSYTLVSDIKRIKKEIAEFLESGKTIIIIPPKENIYAVMTNGYELIRLLSIIPIDNLVFHAGSGYDLMYYTDNIYENLFSINDIQFEYHYYLESSFESSIDLAIIPNSKRIIAKAFIFKSAQLLILPVSLSRDNYKSDKGFRTVVNNFLKSIDTFHEEKQFSIEEFELPSWTNNYPILEENSLSEKIIETQGKIDNLIAQKEKQQKRLEAIQKYKLTLTSSGKELEKIVTQIFSELGFTIWESEHNRADGIFEYNNHKFVIEIKGVSKSAAEKHAAQLEKWVSEFIENNGTIPKAILVVNGFRKKELSKRTEDIFPKQMINYSKKRDHCLLTTTQLLCLFLEIKTNPQEKGKLLQELFDTTGIYNRFEDPVSFLSKTNS